MSSTLEDGDGDPDLVLFFRTDDLVNAGALDANTSQVLLSGVTLGGGVVAGIDAVRVVGHP